MLWLQILIVCDKLHRIDMACGLLAPNYLTIPSLFKEPFIFGEKKGGKNEAIRPYAVSFLLNFSHEIKTYPYHRNFLTSQYQSRAGHGLTILDQRVICHIKRKALISSSREISDFGNWIILTLSVSNWNFPQNCPVTPTNGGLGKKCIEQKVLIFDHRIRIWSQNMPFPFEVCKKRGVPPLTTPRGFWKTVNIFIKFYHQTVYVPTLNIRPFPRKR